MWTNLSTEKHGDGFGIKIDVKGKNLPDLETDKIRSITRKSRRLITGVIQEAILQNNPKTKIESEENRKLVNKVFEQPIFVEEIENQYCNEYCCKHLPWFIVTTKVGRIKIGHRKSVISICWMDTVILDDANELFPDENVTKEGRIIHAWSIEKAKMYVSKIINSKKNNV